MRIDKSGEEITKNISYVLQFIDSTKLYQTLSIIFLNEFIELNLNTDMMIIHVKLVETLKMI